MLTVVLLAGCTDDSGPRIPDFGHGWAGSSLPERRADVPYPLVGAVNLCVDRPGSIEITDVSLEHSENGLRVDAFATRHHEPPYPQPETFTETLWELGFDPGEATVDAVCPDPTEGATNDRRNAETDGDPSIGVTGFGVQFSKPADETARGAIIRVTYRSDGETYVHRIGFELVLCEKGQRHPECELRESGDYGW